MNILTNYTRRCLKQNRVRTLVTLIGIILSVSLFTAVAEGAWSGRQYLMNVAVASRGTYHGMFDEISDAELAELRAQKGVDQTATLDGIGWALVGRGTQELSQPYLRIRSMSDNFTDLVALELLEGRMPQNDRELLISDRTAAVTGAELELGQTLTLSVGQRVTKDGKPLSESNLYFPEEEQLADVTEDTWTVVGIYHLYNDVESYDLPGSLALTVGGTGTDHKVFFTLDNIGDTWDFLKEHAYGSTCAANDDLLLYAGYDDNERLNAVIYGLVAILFGLIFLGSVALIYNSFSISVSERTKQFGLLKSIGATNRQIRRMVLTEALLLCVIGIPVGLLVGCGGIGLTLRFLQPAFSSMVSTAIKQAVTIKLVLHGPSLAMAAGIGLFTALVSAWIPAKRATRLSPISAIRQSTDVKVRAKEIKVSPLTGKLFGFPGTLASKNFKRSRKQYRSTVVSLFMSIVLFVSAFSFADYLRKDVAETVADSVPDLRIVNNAAYDYSLGADLDPAKTEALAKLLKNEAHVEDVAWAIHYDDRLRFPSAVISQAAKDSVLEEVKGSYYGLYSELCFLQEADYRSLCAKAGVDPETRQAVAYAKQQLMTYYEDGSRSYQLTSLFRSDAFPMNVTLDVIQPREGMVYGEAEYEPYDKENNGFPEDGEITGYYFIPAEDVHGNYVDYIHSVVISPEEAAVKREFTIGGLLQELPLASYGHYLTIYLPLEGTEDLWRSARPVCSPTIDTLFLQAPEHATAKAEVTALLQGQELNELYGVHDTREDKEGTQSVLLVLNVFTFGFIILISLIAAANVFNTISTNVALRRREFATLKSVGMGGKAFGRMMRFECLLYGSKALLWGLPVSVGISWLIWQAVTNAFITAFRLPWTAMAIAAGSVFLVVFATMIYATRKIKKDNPIDALKQETL